MYKTILIIEEDILVVQNLKEIVEKTDLKVIIMHSELFIAKWIIETNIIDLVIIDIDLKKFNEQYDVVNHIICKEKIPFILTTGVVNFDILDLIVRTRPSFYVSKPYKWSDILINIKIALQNYTQREIKTTTLASFNLNNKSYVLNKVFEYINSNICENINVQDLVATTNWGDTFFYKTFKEHFGMTPQQYVLKRKIDKAKLLLYSKQFSIAQTANELGFKSNLAFSNSFKKTAGKSPESYLEQKEVDFFN